MVKLEPFPGAMGWEHGSPACRTTITHTDRQPFMFMFTPTANLELPINITCMAFDCGRKTETSGETHAGTGRIWTPRTARAACEFKPGTFLLWDISPNHLMLHVANNYVCLWLHADSIHSLLVWVFSWDLENLIAGIFWLRQGLH